MWTICVERPETWKKHPRVLWDRHSADNEGELTASTPCSCCLYLEDLSRDLKTVLGFRFSTSGLSPSHWRQRWLPMLSSEPWPVHTTPVVGELCWTEIKHLDWKLDYLQLTVLLTKLMVVVSWRYVLLHHVMGELEKEKGSWGYVEGGMGGVSNAIASSARSHGASIFTEKARLFDLTLIQAGVYTLHCLFLDMGKELGQCIPALGSGGPHVRWLALNVFFSTHFRVVNPKNLGTTESVFFKSFIKVLTLNWLGRMYKRLWLVQMVLPREWCWRMAQRSTVNWFCPTLRHTSPSRSSRHRW